MLGLLLLVHLLAGRTAANPLDRYPSSFTADLEGLTELVALPGRHWVDHETAYPPLLVAEVELVVTPDLPESGPRLAWSQLVLHLVAVGAMGWGWGRRGAVTYLAMTTPLVLYPFIFQRTDMLAVALSVIGVAAWRRSHHTTSGLVLALAFFAKAWPVVLGPGLIAERRWRGAGAWMATLVGGTAAWVAYGGFGALSQVLTFRGSTGAQIESLTGNAITLLTGDPWRVEQGAVRIGDLPAVVRLALPALGLLLAAAAWALVWRRVRAGRPSLAHGVGSLTAVAGLLCTSTLLSTQFTSWLLPWGAIIAAELRWPASGTRSQGHHVADGGGTTAARMELALVVLVVAIAAAAGPLSWLHPDVGRGEVGGLILTARNLALLGVLVIGLRRLALLDDEPGMAVASIVAGRTPAEPATDPAVDPPAAVSAQSGQS